MAMPGKVSHYNHHLHDLNHHDHDHDPDQHDDDDDHHHHDKECRCLGGLRPACAESF